MRNRYTGRMLSCCFPFEFVQPRRAETSADCFLGKPHFACGQCRSLESFQDLQARLAFSCARNNCPFLVSLVVAENCAFGALI